MNVRNFYLRANADGRRSNVTCGPAAKDGGIDIIMTQRHKGSIIETYHITCSAIGNRLFTRIFDLQTRQVVAEKETER